MGLVIEAMKIPDGFVGRDGNGERAFVIFVKLRPGALVVVVGGVGPEEGGGAGAEDLESVVEVSAGREGLGTEAGRGVVDFDSDQGIGGAVGDGGVDPCGVAAGEGERGDGKHEQGDETHQGKGIRWCRRDESIVRANISVDGLRHTR